MPENERVHDHTNSDNSSQVKFTLTAPNYTQCPNDILDHWLPHLREAELKVLLVIIRKTFGYHKKRDKISISQIEKITGLHRSN